MKQFWKRRTELEAYAPGPWLPGVGAASPHLEGDGAGSDDPFWKGTLSAWRAFTQPDQPERTTSD